MTKTGHVPGQTGGQTTGQETPMSLARALGDASARVPDQTRPDQCFFSGYVDHQTNPTLRARAALAWTTR